MVSKNLFSSYKTILIVGLFFRILTAIFSEGYGMHDDHFLTIEASASWANHYDYNHWLPWTEGSTGKPEGHSFTYVGLNYLYFAACKFVGINDPKILMVINRLIHALLSILVVYFGIKITEKVSNRKNAITVGWILSLLWLMPFMSVRNLVEMVSIPFLMWGMWLLLKAENRRKYFVYAGLLIGLAISFRFQVAIFTVGVAAYYLLKREFSAFFYFCLGNVLSFCLTQGPVDYYIWGYPFAEFIGYVEYNLNQGTQYLPNTNYFMYFYVLFGVLLFPFGLLIGTGFFRSVKKQLFLFVPTAAFILFHTLYPNRQERFILSILPFFIILGVIGFQTLRERSFWNTMWNFSWKFFWILNLPLLLFFTFASTKKSRIDAMYSLYANGKNNPKILMEGTGDASISQMPKFYANTWYASFKDVTVRTVDTTFQADYIFFSGKGELGKRVAFYKKQYPHLHLHKICAPSTIDQIVHDLNPRNVNEYIEVWKVK
jgi:hypothetical protein